MPTADAIDTFSAQFDDLFTCRAARQALHHYLIGLLPRSCLLCRRYPDRCFDDDHEYLGEQWK